MKKVICLVLGLVMLNVSNANSVSMPSYQTPTFVTVHTNNTLVVGFPEVFNVGCTTGAGRFMYVKVGNSQGVTEEVFKRIYSTLMVAIANGNKVKFLYARKGTICEGGTLVIQH